MGAVSTKLKLRKTYSNTLALNNKRFAYAECVALVKDVKVIDAIASELWLGIRNVLTEPAQQVCSRCGPILC